MQESFLIGTYTKNQSHGIYQLTLDNQAERLTPGELVTTIGSPTYLAQSPAKMIYAVDRKQTAAELNGGVAVINPALKIVQELVTPGAAPAYVGIDSKRQLVLVANYHSGAVTTYRIDQPTGRLTLADQVQLTGKLGPHVRQQDGNHPHFADITPTNQLLVADLGADEVLMYDLSAVGHLKLSTTLSLPAGFGPRHVVFNHNKPIMYVIGELSSQIAVLNYQTGEELQIIDTIPNDFNQLNEAAAIRITTDNRHLYASNRGHNSIAGYRILTDGRLALLQIIKTAGNFPRDFNFNAQQDLVVVVHQKSADASLLKRNLATGELTVIQTEVAVPEGVCVMPLK